MRLACCTRAKCAVRRRWSHIRPEIGEEALGHDYEAEVTEPTCAAGGYTTYTCTRCGDSYTADETEADPEAHVAVLGTVLKAPTCTTTGIGRYECEVCGANLGYQVITATHKWDAGEVVEEATCGTDGKMVYHCTVEGCDGEKEEVIPATGAHNMEETVIEATCTEPAKVGEKCTVCGQEGETEVVAGSEALGHDLQLDTENEGYVAATCEEGGHDTLKCSRCDYTEEKDTEALGHQYDEGVHTEATCEDASGVLYTCEVCGATKVEEYPPEIGEEALGHDYEAEVTEPTCAAGGYTTYTCTRCGDSYMADETEADPEAHVAVLGTVLKAPTCTTTGIGRYECEVCGANLGYQVITATHKWDAGEVVEEATCGTDGKMVYHCTVEGCDGEKEEVIPATGAHNMEETVIEATCTEPAKVGEKCTVCGQEGETEVVAGSEALGHDLQLDTENEGYVAATCEEGGHDTLKCSRCDYTEEKDTEALGHQYDEGVHTEATCEDASGVLYTCEVCGATKVEEYPPEIGEEALGHDYEAEVTEPTCAAGGYTTYTCTRCGDSYMADETEADPEAHVAVLGTVLKAPTCTTTGIGRYECEVCGANLGYQVITATHKWDAGEVVEEATCGTDGKIGAPLHGGRLRRREGRSHP